MTQDTRIHTIKDRLRTATSNVRFAKALAEGCRFLNQREANELSDICVELIRELGQVCDRLRLGEATQSEAD